MRKTAGISLLLLIFLSLCLITFSLLSLSGATADQKLSQKGAERTARYYETVSKANKILAFVDQYFLHQDIHMNVAFADVLSTEFTDSSFVFTQKDDLSTLTFKVPLTGNSTQLLQVILSFESELQEGDPFYQIISWQIINNSDWTPDQSQNLMRTKEFTPSF